MAGLLYFKFGTQKSGIDHHFAPYVRDLVPDTFIAQLYKTQLLIVLCH